MSDSEREVHRSDDHATQTQAARVRALHDACRSGDVERLRVVLACDAAAPDDPSSEHVQPLVDACDENNKSALFVASKRGHLEVVELLLASGAGVDNTGRESRKTPLFVACKEGRVDIARLLLKSGADVNAMTLYDGTPLCVAAERGHVEIVRLLLENDAAVNEYDHIEYTALTSACEEGHTEVVRLLLAHGADTEIASEDNSTPLGVASAFGYTEIVRLLLASDADAHRGSGYNGGSTPLYWACQGGHLDIVHMLFEHGADVDEVVEDTYGYSRHTPLSVAVEGAHPDVVRFLLEHGADVSNNSYLDLACKEIRSPYQRRFPITHSPERRHQVFFLLLEYGPDINDADGWMPLHVASRNGFLAAVRTLLERGADVNLRNRDGQSALHMASESGRTDIVRFLLLECGVDVDATATDGSTALFAVCKSDCGGYACESNRLAVARLLLKHHADVNKPRDDGSTPLHAAAKHGRIEFVRELLDAGAAVDTVNSAGETVLDVAKASKRVERTDVVQMLLDARASGCA